MLNKASRNVRSLRRLFSVSAVVAGAAVGFVTPASASAQLVDFEGLGYGAPCQWGGGAEFTSLSGKTWAGFLPLDLYNFSTTCGRSTNSGYSSLLSANVGNVIAIGYDGAWLSSYNPFVLNSLVAGAGWLNPTKLTLSFYLNTQLMSTSTLMLNTSQTGGSVFSGFYSGPTDYISFIPDYSNGVDVFNTFDESCIGATGPCTQASYKTWFVDNLDFSPATVVITTPEPGSVALMAMGLLAVAGVVRRKRQR